MKKDFKKKLQSYKRKRATFKFLKITSLIITIIILITIVFYALANIFLTTVISWDKFSISEPISFLLIGSDYREEAVNYSSGARADSLIVVTLNPQNSRNNIELNAVSIPRDNIANITCMGSDYYDKINASLNEGLILNNDINEGIDCTVATVENYLNIDIDYYIMATFENLINLIDSLGGIDIDSPYAFCEQDSQGNGYTEDGSCLENSIYIEEGLQTMDGETALAYARQRHLTSDYERNLRQQQVIGAIVKKILSDPVKYSNEFISFFTNSFYTNIESSDLLNYFNFASSLFNNISLNLANDVPIYIDYKTSPFENYQGYLENGSLQSSEIDNTDVEPMSVYYSNLDTFEEYSYIKRVYVNKEQFGIASSLTKDTKDLNPLGIEISTYSLLSSNLISDIGAYTYVDYYTLYYTSNLLQKSLNEELQEPTFNYNIYSQDAYESPIYREF